MLIIEQLVPIDHLVRKLDAPINFPTYYLEILTQHWETWRKSCSTDQGDIQPVHLWHLFQAIDNPKGIKNIVQVGDAGSCYLKT